MHFICAFKIGGFRSPNQPFRPHRRDRVGPFYRRLRCAVNETEKVLTFHLDASTFPNQVGTDQKRTVTSLTADELIMKYSNPAAIFGVQIHQVWKRAE
jgi:hypothetical protein